MSDSLNVNGYVPDLQATGDLPNIPFSEVGGSRIVTKIMILPRVGEVRVM